MRYTTVTLKYYPRQQPGQPPTTARSGQVQVQIDLDAIECEIGRKAAQEQIRTSDRLRRTDQSQGAEVTQWII